jgi:hypothetical protein
MSRWYGLIGLSSALRTLPPTRILSASFTVGLKQFSGGRKKRQAAVVGFPVGRLRVNPDVPPLAPRCRVLVDKLTSVVAVYAPERERERVRNVRPGKSRLPPVKQSISLSANTSNSFIFEG